MTKDSLFANTPLPVGQVHALKTWPEHFKMVVHGWKRCEIRKDDRDFKAGDVLHLREYDPKKQEYTGQETLVQVTHILIDNTFLQPGYVAMSIYGITRARK